MHFYSMLESYKVLFTNVGRKTLFVQSPKLQWLNLQRNKGPLCLSRGLTRIIVFIRYERILMWLPCSCVAFYYNYMSYLLCTLDERQWFARLLARYLSKTLNAASQRLECPQPIMGWITFSALEALTSKSIS